MAGRAARVAELVAALGAEGVRAWPLPVSHAFHSPLLRPMLAPFAALLGELPLQAPSAPLGNNLDGSLREAAPTADEWARHLVEPVRFADNVAALRARGVKLALEVAPGAVLGRLAAAQAPELLTASTWTPGRGLEDLAEAVARLTAAGHDLDLSALHAGEPRRRVPLPTTSFGGPRLPLVVRSASAPRADEPAPREIHLSGADPLLADHQVGGRRLLAATAAWALLAEAVGGSLEDARIERPLALGAEERITLSVRRERGRALLVGPEGPIASARPGATTSAAPPPALSGGVKVEAEALYARFRAAELVYGPSFRAIEAAWAEGQAARATLRPLAGPALTAGVLDGALQALAASFPADQPLPTFVPVHLGALSITGDLHIARAARLQVVSAGEELVRLSAWVLDEGGRTLATLQDVSLKRVRALAPLRAPVFVEEPNNNAPPTGRWAVVSEGGALAEGLRAALQARGVEPVGLDAGAAPGSLTGAVFVAQRGHDLRRAAVAFAGLAASLPTGAHLVLLTEGAQPPDPDPDLAALLGLLRSAGWERPGLSPVGLDVGGPEDLDAACAELGLATPRELRLRGGRVARRSLAPYTPKARWTPSSEGCYLLTGASGGVGRALAERLAVRAPGVGIALLTRGAPDSLSPLVERLRRLGARPLALQADLEDLSALRAAVDRAVQSLGPVRAVFHGAGARVDGNLLSIDEGAIDRALAGRVTGLTRLITLLPRPVEGYVLHGSLAGAVGAPGQGAYAAAQAWLDGLAHRLRAQGTAAVALDWSLWGETGMGATAALRERAGRLGVRPLGTEEALDALERCVGSGEAQLLIGAFELPSRPAERVAPAVAAPRASVQRALQDHLVCHLARRLSLPEAEVDPERPVLDLGLDSVAVVDLVRALEEELGVTLYPTLFFEHQTA
ncbi:SDR family NAD(P)-dependent oxidoreductase, partial [Myxococcota bacterium]|nr:SDR family NAD(P)-dependent oxidoreductase [Myxococcota bacterium]